MKKQEIREKAVQFLISDGYEIDLKDDFWMEEYEWHEHKTKDIIDLMVRFSESLQSDVSVSDFSDCALQGELECRGYVVIKDNLQPKKD